MQTFIKKVVYNAEIFDTICSATSTRQEEAAQLSSKCDAMVIIGGKHSANSLHLAELCASRCANTQFIAHAGELDTARLRDADTIGVTAGASAPEWIIKEVLVKMSDEILIQENPVEEQAETAAPESVEAAEIPAAEAVAVEEAPAVEEAAPAAEVPAAGEAKEKSFDEMLEDSLKTIYNGDKVSGTVVAITPTEVSVDLGTKYSAFIPATEFTDDGETKLEDAVHVGDPIEAIVVRVNDVEGTAQLSKKRLDAVKKLGRHRVRPGGRHRCRRHSHRGEQGRRGRLRQGYARFCPRFPVRPAQGYPDDRAAQEEGPPEDH